jgi:Ca-activated chloride channel family protein
LFASPDKQAIKERKIVLTSRNKQRLSCLLCDPKEGKMIKIHFVAVLCLFFVGLFWIACLEEGDDGFGDENAGAMDGDTDTDADMEGGFYDNQGDKYEYLGTNPFIVTAHDPFSTFAADVDTASYDIFRRDVNNGYLPTKESVRLEDYVNYFTYNYPAPAPEAEHPFTISLAAGPDIFGNETSLVRVGIQGKLPPPFEKKPTNLVFLVDVSGSMTSGDKLPLAKHVLTKTLDVLDDGDKVSIVTYASNVGVRLSPTDVSNKGSILSAIDSLSSGGSTAGASGINLAYDQAEEAFIEDGINHIILCTDGDFNVGISGDQALVDLIVEKRKSGITLTVLGFGVGNLNDSMMEKISNAGNGFYAMISSEAQADRYVEDRMLATMVLIAKDMKIQVEFNPDDVYAYRLLGYENRLIDDDDFRDDTVDGGEIGAGHRVTALYEVVLPGGTIPDKPGVPEAVDGEPVEGEREIDGSNMVLVKVRYKDVDAAEADPAYEVRSTITTADIKESHGAANGDFKWAAAVAAFAEILKESPYANVDGLSTIEDIVTEKNWLDSDRAEFVTLFNKAKPMFDL